ncbi:asparagine synthase-related protein [Psychroserpens sp. BH13MA-6]
MENTTDFMKGIPSFIGCVRRNSSPKQSHLKGLNTIFDHGDFTLFTTHSNDSELRTFHHSDQTFLWTGGLDLGSDFNLTTFDHHKADHKFVYVSYTNNTLELHTDHYSKIPLVYALQDNNLYFSSSLELLLKYIGGEKKRINKNGLLFYYNFGFTAFEHMLLEDVKSLAGGQTLKYANEDLQIESYYTVYNNQAYCSKSLEDHMTLIDQSLLASTQSTLEPYEHIGIALSGGVDSGYLAQKISECGKSFNAYTLGFKDDYNEFERVDYLSKRLNFTTKKIILSPEDIVTNYLEASKHASFPVGFNNSILNFIYKQAHSDGVSIMFDGDGADRLFLGMNKYVQLKKILKFYAMHKACHTHHLMAKLLKIIKHPTAQKLRFYFEKFNKNFQFYGERKLPNTLVYDEDFENLLHDIALPKELKLINHPIDKWLFFSFFSVYYTPTFFFHTPYELQLKQGIVSNPQFWSDDLVNLALSIPVDQKLRGNTTKLVLREAAQQKIDDGYWNLSKIGLQNSYSYLKQSDLGKSFIAEQVQEIKKGEAYHELKEAMPDKTIDAERLIPFHIWNENMSQI